MKPHKHAEMIKAWADGAEIECYNGLGYWLEDKNPDWHAWNGYRIKPETKPEPVKTTMYLYVTGTTQKQLWLDKEPPETFLYRTISEYIGSIEVLK